MTPVFFKDQRLGVLVACKANPSPFFDAGQLKVARTVAEYLGIVLTLGELQKRRTAEDRALRDLEIAAQIQTSLTPAKFHDHPGLDLFGVCRPALRAGGDYFDILALQGGATLCVIADVMGKGIPAALLAMMLRTTIRAVAKEGRQCDPGRILTEVNRLLAADLIHLEVFVTVACVCIAPRENLLRLASAGHLPGLLQRAGGAGEIVSLDADGTPLGIFADVAYSAETAEFLPGDRLLLLTDGIVETAAPENPSSNLFGESRVRQLLSQSRGLAAKETIERLLEEVLVFSAQSPPTDDRTAILAVRKP